MPPLYPLSFEPLFQNYPWGGRRLEALLGKRLGAGPHYAESWEVVDHPQHQSIVAAGPLAGWSLHKIVERHGRELFGRHDPQPRFPLLLKFLDAKQTLSVQVHPNDSQGAELDPPDLGKTEAWVVLAAEPGSKIYAGLKPGVDRHQLAEAIAAGTCERCLHTFEPSVGDCVFIEAGTVHALGAGLVIAEIQQASNTTFRLYDWNRVDAAGKGRPLHVDQALEVIDFSRGAVSPQTPQPGGAPDAEQLIACDKFVLRRWLTDQPTTLALDARFHIVAAIDGAASVMVGGESWPLSKGSTLLLPASLGEVVIHPEPSCTWLDMFLP